MKTSNYILPAIIFALLLSSCGSLSISQKRYSRGLNIDLFSSKDEKQEFKTKKTVKKSVPALAKQKEKETELELVDEPVLLPAESAVNMDLNQIDDNISEQPGGKDLNKYPAVKKGKSESGLTQKQAVRKLKREVLTAENSSVKSNSPNETNDEVSTLILVILCIIPPLGILAVYLHEGEINDKFWISLILYFLFIVPGIIYSLLVVLDVI